MLLAVPFLASWVAVPWARRVGAEEGYEGPASLTPSGSGLAFVGPVGPLASPASPARRSWRPLEALTDVASEQNRDEEWQRLIGPDFDTVQVDLYGEPHDMWMPDAWAVQFEKGSVKCLDEGPDEMTFSAALVADPSSKVSFKVLPAESSKAQREVQVASRLSAFRSLGASSLNGVMRTFERYTFRGSTYLLTESSEESLAEVLGLRFIPARMLVPWYQSASVRGIAAMSMQEALPIIIDVLRGLDDLEDCGVVHGNLSPSSIMIASGRAYLAGLGDACFVQDEDPECACSRLQNGAEHSRHAGSAFLEAPEVGLHGPPSGTISTVWTAGILYAWLRFGYCPTELSFRAWALRGRELNDDDIDLRRRIRDYITNFSLDSDPAFHQSLTPSEQRLLERMTTDEPHRRLSLDEALHEAMSVAQVEGVDVPEMREPPTLPSAWVHPMEAPKFFKGLDTSDGAWQ
mmetsp:Transcript_111198/g.321458  ORF Transcript_111198/g.321458 Transcript_111198/m.321458 type:complete len:461 (-) Transcript_111198:250-1632(-)